MKRRSVITLSLGAILLCSTLGALANDFKPGLIKKELAADKAVLLTYSATWCSICAAQDRAISSLRSENSAYNEKISFINVDWDTYANHAVSTSRNVSRHSTLILLRGDKELDRLVSQTSKKSIKVLLDKALKI